MDDKKKSKQIETPEELDDFMSGIPLEEDVGEEEEEEVSEELNEEEEDLALPEMEEEEEEKEEDMLDIAADVPIQVVAVMGKRNISIKELASLKLGEVIELNRPANEIVDLVAGGKLIAKGELVEIEGKLGVKIVKMLK